MIDGTKKFNVKDDANQEMKRILTTVYDALRERVTTPSTRSSVTSFRKTPLTLQIITMPVVSSARSTVMSFFRSLSDSIFPIELIPNPCPFAGRGSVL